MNISTIFPFVRKVIQGSMVLVLLNSTIVYAKETESPDVQIPVVNTKNAIVAPKKEPIQIPKISKREIPTFRSTEVLPLFTRQLGLDPKEAPLPFSVMLLGNYFQGTVVASNFSGTLTIAGGKPIALPGGGIPNILSIKEVEISSVKQRFLSGGIRVGVNVLPFFSVYGLFINSNGTTETTMDMNMNVLGKDVYISTPFSMDFDATTAGIGASATIGGDVFFLSLDANYTFTMVESISVLIHTINASTRVGMHKRVGSETIAVWIGGNYMANVGGSSKLGAVLSVEQLNDLMPGTPIVGELPAKIAWAVDQKPLSVFSAVLGFKYSPFQNLDFVTELTFIDRMTATVMLAYNF